MNRTRLLLFAVTILILAAAIFTSIIFEDVSLIKRWNIPACPPSFLDSRQIGMASESYALGYDPLVENPVNPTKEQLAYPRIWHLLFALGIDQSHTNLIGTVFVILFFIGIGMFWFSKKFDTLTYIILSIAILSPPVMLGIERGNIELVMFFILSLALLINYYSTIASLFVFVFAAILKLYPVFGFAYLLKENKRRFLMLFLPALGVFIIYILLTLDDIKQIYLVTPKFAGSSFGLNVWWMGLRHPRYFNLQISDNGILFLQIISYIAVFLIIACALFFSLRNKDINRFRQGRHLDAFRVGAAIYIGSYITTNNFDYRLMFLIFTIPQIVAWLRDKERGYSLVPLITLAAMLFSLWSFLVMRYAGMKSAFLMEEFCNWIVLYGLIYLFTASVPDWLGDYLRRPFLSIKGFKGQVAENR
ncbi:MAG TPA: hypothetical protein ENG83_12680 [Nitrospirae bacterium]|nr:hypothetical protein [Nitrospirota bacterium]HDZ00584.1 hypothetical protein [Nitrospirota bacterium]